MVETDQYFYLLRGRCEHKESIKQSLKIYNLHVFINNVKAKKRLLTTNDFWPKTPRARIDI